MTDTSKKLILIQSGAYSTIYVYTEEDNFGFISSTGTRPFIIEDSTPIRAVVKEYYYTYIIYSTYMLRYHHDTSSSVTGATSLPYSLTNITTDYDFYPLTSDVNTNSASYVVALQDSTMPGPDTGAWIDDLREPLPNFGVDGFSYDGAIQIDISSNYAAKFDNDRIRYSQPLVIYYSPYIANSTDYLAECFKCDDNLDNSIITADSGNNATYKNISDGLSRNTSTDSTTTARVNRALNLGGTGYIELNTSNYGNDFFQKGSLSIDALPQFSESIAVDQTFFLYNISGTDYLKLIFDSTTDEFHFLVCWGGTLLTLNSSTPGYDMILQNWQRIQCNWDSDRNFAQLSINGRIEDTGRNTGTPSSSAPIEVLIGTDSSQINPANIIVDNIKTFNDMVLPYGTVFTGNSDIDAHHADILFYWDCVYSGTGEFQTGTITKGYAEISIDDNGLGQAVGVTGTANTAIQSTSDSDNIYFESDGNLNLERGSISFWYKATEFDPQNFSTSHIIAGTNQTGYVAGDLGIEFNPTDNKITFFIVDETGLWTGTRQVGYYSTTHGVQQNEWNHYEFIWDDTVEVHDEYHLAFKLNGVFLDPDLDVDADEPWTSASSTSDFYLLSWKTSAAYSGGGVIDNFFITNNPYTPQMPTIGGHPLITPIVDISGDAGYQVGTVQSGKMASAETNKTFFIDLSLLAKNNCDDIFDLCTDDGGDIRVKTGDGSAYIARDIINIDKEAKTGLIAINAPSLNVGTTIRVYYDGTSTEPAVDSTYGSENAWDTTYEAVWHTHDFENGLILDATDNDRDMTVNSRYLSHVYKESYAATQAHQAVVYDGQYYYFIDDNTLSKKEQLWGDAVVTNSDPTGDVNVNCDHCGAGEVYGDYLYVPIEKWISCASNSYQFIAVFNKSDLSYVTSYDISAQNHESAALTIDPDAGTDGIIYVTSYCMDGSNDTNTIWAYDLDDGAYNSGENITISGAGTALNYGQGICLDPAGDGFIIATGSTDKQLKRVKLDGTYLREAAITYSTGDTYESVYTYDGDLYRWVDLAGGNCRLDYYENLNKGVANPVGSRGAAYLGDAVSQVGYGHASVAYTLPETGTISFFINPQSSWNYMSVWDNSADGNDWECWVDGSDILKARIDGASVNYTLPTVDADYFASFCWAKSGASASTKLIVNGTQRDTDTNTWITPGTYFYLNGGNAANAYGNAIFYFVAIRNIDLSADADLIVSEYNNQSDNAGFWSFGNKIRGNP